MTDSATFAAGFVAPWSGRFYSLWDTGYAKIHIPIIASVSEHQPTAWTSFFFDLHILICVFPVGLWYVIKDINDARVFSESPTASLCHPCLFIKLSTSCQHCMYIVVTSQPVLRQHLYQSTPWYIDLDLVLGAFFSLPFFLLMLISLYAHI